MNYKVLMQIIYYISLISNTEDELSKRLHYLSFLAPIKDLIKSTTK